MGLFGGGEGGYGGIFVKKRGDTQFRTFSEAFDTVSDSKFTRVVLGKGDEVMIHSPGGGGYGPAAEWSAEAIADDLRRGWISGKAARELYGHGRRRNRGTRTKRGSRTGTERR